MPLVNWWTAEWCFDRPSQLSQSAPDSI